jgi:hypothetical protein
MVKLLHAFPLCDNFEVFEIEKENMAFATGLATPSASACLTPRPKCCSISRW